MGTQKWSDIRARSGFTRADEEEIGQEVERITAELALRRIRQERHLSQADVAEAAGMDQSEYSKMERRSDWRLSTLRRVAKAMGGELHVTIRIEGREFPLDGSDSEAA